MTTSFDILAIRRSLGRDLWGLPEPFGPDGWLMNSTGKYASEQGRIIITSGPAPDSDEDWWHASISRPTMPTYDDLVKLHRAVWGDGWGVPMLRPTVGSRQHPLDRPAPVRPP